MSNVVFHPGDIFVQSIPPVVHASRRPPPMTPEEIANERAWFWSSFIPVESPESEKFPIFKMLRR